MANIVDICNRALSHVGRPAVSAVFPPDGSTESKECNRHYNSLRKELLRSEEWNFAIITITPSLHSEDPPASWSFRYQYPTNCEKIVRLDHETRAKNEPPIEYEVQVTSDGSAKTILTDFENPDLTYVFDQQDPVLFDSAFEEAFSWRLAMEIAVPLTRSSKIYNTSTQGFRIAMSNARVQNRNEGIKGRKPRPGSIRAR